MELAAFRRGEKEKSVAEVARIASTSAEQLAADAMELAAFRRIAKEKSAIVAAEVRSRDLNAQFSAMSPSGMLARATRVGAIAVDTAGIDHATKKYGDLAVATALSSTEMQRLRDSAAGAGAATGQGASQSDAARSAAAKLRAEQRQLNTVMHEGHSAARGLAQGFGGMVFTYGSIVPLLAGAAISNTISSMVKEGMALERHLTFVSQLTDGATVSVKMFENAMTGAQISVKEGAEGLRALAQSGFDSVQALIALPEILKLATVGELSVGQAALTATGIMHAFNLELGDLPHIVDVLTKSAAESNTSVASMMESLKTASLGADQFGVKLEEMSAALEIMGKRNITGTAAGTALKNLMSELSSPTEKAAKRMEQLGFSAYDSLGHLKPFEQQLKELRDAMANLGEQSRNTVLTDLFNERSRRGAAALLKDFDDLEMRIERLRTGANGFADSVNQALGQTVSGQVKTLANDFQVILGSAFEHTSDAWSNLVAELADFVKSTGFKDAIMAISTGVIFLAENIGTLTAVAATGVMGFRLYAFGMAAVTAASTLMVGGVAEAGAATAALSATLSRVLWPLAIVSALTAAYYALKGGTDEAAEAHKRLMRESDGVVASLERSTREALESARAYALVAKTGGDYARILAEIRVGGAAESLTSAPRKALDAARDNYVKAQEAFEAGSGDSLNLMKTKVTMLQALGKFQEANAVAERGYNASAANDAAKNYEGQEKALADLRRVTDGYLTDVAGRMKADKSYVAQGKDLRTGLVALQGKFDITKATDIEGMKALSAEVETYRKRIQALSTTVGSLKDDKSAAQRASLIKAEADNLSKIQRQLATARMGALQAADADEMKLLQARHSAKLITDGEFMMRELALVKAGERAKLAEIDASGEEAAAQHVKLLLDQSEAYTASIEGSKGAKNALEVQASALKALQTAVKNLMQTESGRLQLAEIAKQKVVDSAAAQETAQIIKLRGELKTLAIESKKFWDGEAQNQAKAARQVATEDQLRYASPEAAAYISAAAAETEKWTSEIEKQAEVVKLLQVSLDAAMSVPMTGTPEELEKLAAMNDVLAERVRLLNQLKGKSEGLPDQAGTAAVAKLRKDSAAEFQEGIAEAITTGIIDGGQAGKEKLRDLLVAELRKPITLFINTAVNMLMGSVGFGPNAPGGAAGGVGGLTGAVSGISNAYNVATSGFAGMGSASGLLNTGVNSISKGLFNAGFNDAGQAMSEFGNSALKYTDQINMAGDALGYLSAIYSASEGKWGAAAGAAIGTYLGGPLGATIGSTIGSFVDDLFGGGGGPKTDASYGNIGVNGYAGFGDTSKTGGAGKYVTEIEGQWANLSASLGLTNKLVAGAYYSIDSAGDDMTFFNARGTLDGQNISDRMDRMGGTRGAAVGRDAADLEAAMQEEITRILFGALKVSDIGDQAKTYLNSVEGSFTALTTNADKLDAMATAMSNVQVIHDFTAALKGLPFDPLKTLSFNAAKGLIEAANGLGNLSTNLSGFYANFYTEGERSANLAEVTSKAFAELGLTMPEVNDQMRANYKEQVLGLMALDQSVPANAKATAGALALQDAVSTLAPGFDEVVRTAQQVEDSLKSMGLETANLNVEILRAQGDVSGADAAQRALDISTNLYSAAEVAIYDHNDALRKSIDTILANNDLQDQLSVLHGSRTQTQVDRENALKDATDATTRSLMAQVYAQEDLNTAVDKAMATLTRSVDKAKESLTTSYDTDLEALEASKTSSQDTLTKSYELQAASAKLAVDKLTESVGKLKTLSDRLRSALDAMVIGGNEEGLRRSAQADLQTALAIARAGGPLPVDSKDFEKTLSILSQPSEQLFSDFNAYARDFHQTFSGVTELSTLADASLTEQESLLVAMNNATDSAKSSNDALIEVTLAGFDSQITTLKKKYEADLKALDETLRKGQEQVDVLNRVDTSVLTVAGAVAGLSVAISAVLAANTAAAAAAEARAVAAITEAKRLSDAATLPTKSVTLLGATPLPAFAQGINYVPHDMDARIHEGEAVVPRVYNPFNPNAHTNQGRDDDAVVAELRALREELRALQSLQRSGNTHAKKFADLLNQVTSGGDAMQVESLTSSVTVIGV